MSSLTYTLIGLGSWSLRAAIASRNASAILPAPITQRFWKVKGTLLVVMVGVVVVVGVVEEEVPPMERTSLDLVGR